MLITTSSPKIYLSSPIYKPLLRFHQCQILKLIVRTQGIHTGPHKHIPTKKGKNNKAKIREAHTPTDISVSPLSSAFRRGAPTGIVPSRSGYEAAENRQNGADAPILSLLSAIY